jgi:hypothetical protein
VCLPSPFFVPCLQITHERARQAALALDLGEGHPHRGATPFPPFPTEGDVALAPRLRHMDVRRPPVNKGEHGWQSSRVEVGPSPISTPNWVDLEQRWRGRCFPSASQAACLPACLLLAPQRADRIAPSPVFPTRRADAGSA